MPEAVRAVEAILRRARTALTAKELARRALVDYNVVADDTWFAGWVLMDRGVVAQDDEGRLYIQPGA